MFFQVNRHIYIICVLIVIYLQNQLIYRENFLLNFHRTTDTCHSQLRHLYQLMTTHFLRIINDRVQKLFQVDIKDRRSTLETYLIYDTYLLSDDLPKGQRLSILQEQLYLPHLINFLIHRISTPG